MDEVLEVLFVGLHVFWRGGRSPSEQGAVHLPSVYLSTDESLVDPWRQRALVPPPPERNPSLALHPRRRLATGKGGR